MSYVDMSAAFAYKDLLTYQNLNQLGENDKVIWQDTKTRYLALSTGNFTRETTYDDNGQIEKASINTATGLNTIYFLAGINLPHGAIITSLKVWYNAGADGGTASVNLYRITLGNSLSASAMATCTMTASGGSHTIEDTTISNATIDNSTYYYNAELIIDNIGVPYGTEFLGSVITYTITTCQP